MCGIVAVAGRRDVSEILLEGLRRLEYRGYDSAGVAVLKTRETFSLVSRPVKCRYLRMPWQAHPLWG